MVYINSLLPMWILMFSGFLNGILFIIIGMLIKEKYPKESKVCRIIGLIITYLILLIEVVFIVALAYFYFQ